MLYNPLILVHIHTAINMQCMACDVASIWGCQKRYSLSNVLSLAQNSQGNPIQQPGPGRGVKRVGHISLDETRGNRIDCDIPTRNLERQSASEAFNARFSRGIIRLARVSCGTHD